MGTLGHQLPRSEFYVDLDEFIGEAKLIASKHSISIETVISAKHALEIERQNDISVESGNCEDENLAGFEPLLESLSEDLQSIATAITKN